MGYRDIIWASKFKNWRCELSNERNTLKTVVDGFWKVMVFILVAVIIIVADLMIMTMISFLLSLFLASQVAFWIGVVLTVILLVFEVLWFVVHRK